MNFPVRVSSGHDEDEGPQLEMVPSEIVESLDEYIIGQEEAKRMVAIAVRNRWRRRQLDRDMQEEVQPKNIIMIGPTGVGKTEIARRLSKLVKAPFLKVEATKFTETGYHGRDVEQMVRDLVNISVDMVREELQEEVRDEAREEAKERLLDLLLPQPRSSPRDDESEDEWKARQKRNRKRMQQKLEKGDLDDRYVEIDVEQSQDGMMQVFGQAGFEEYGMNIDDMMGGMMPSQKQTRKVKVPEALNILTDQETEKLIDEQEVKRKGKKRARESGIIFIDEIDKITGRASDDRGSGPSVSREGVQRDLLPIIEGATVNTRHGHIKTDHILFVGSGAFHVGSPSDLIPEMQGRFPLRAELHDLNREHFVKILTRPRNALLKQYMALLETEQVDLKFSDTAIQEMAELAASINENTQNIGARRLHTVVEKVVEDISFNADQFRGQTYEIDREYVREALQDVMEDEDLQKYIL